MRYACRSVDHRACVFKCVRVFAHHTLVPKCKASGRTPLQSAGGNEQLSQKVGKRIFLKLIAASWWIGLRSPFSV